MIYPYLAKVGAYSLKHYSVSFIVLPRFSLTSFLFCFCENPGGGWGEDVLPDTSLIMGMCRWMGSHFHDWVDHNGVAHFLIFGVREFIFTVSKLARVASVSVRFRSKERGTRVFLSPSPLFHFFGSCFISFQNRESRSSVFLCSETKRKCLLRRLLANVPECLFCK